MTSRYFYLNEEDEVTGISVDFGRDTELLKFQGIFINTIQLQASLIRFNEKTKPFLMFEHYIAEDYFMTYDILYKAKMKVFFMPDAFHFYRQHSKFRYMSVVKTMKSKLFSVYRGPKEFLSMYRDIYVKNQRFEGVNNEQHLDYLRD